MTLIEAISPTARDLLHMDDEARARLGLSGGTQVNRRRERARNGYAASQVACDQCGNLTTRVKWRQAGWTKAEKRRADGWGEVYYLCRKCSTKEPAEKPVVVARCVKCRVALPPGHADNMCAACAQMRAEREGSGGVIL